MPVVPISENTVGPSGLVRVYLQNTSSYFGVAPYEYYRTITTFGTYGTGNGCLNYPWGAAITPDGSAIWICDGSNHRIAKFQLDGTWIGSFGAYGATDGNFNTPRDIAFDPSGNAYVADSLNYRIQKFNSAGTYVTQWSFDVGHAPTSIVYDSYNSLLWVGSDLSIKSYTTAGVLNSTLSLGVSPVSVAIAPSGDRLYVGTVSGPILSYSTVGTFIGALCSSDLTIGYQVYVDVDRSDTLWICDTYQDIVLKSVPSGDIMSTLMRSGTTGDMACQDPVSSCRYGEYVFIVDNGNHKVHKLTSGTLSNALGFKISASGAIQYTGNLING